ncbi:hypothetical protein ScPMuIL_005065 [Solemya velum]
MADCEYVVLYTHQKTKKAKTWQDGVMKLSCSNQKAVLYDEKRTKLDSMFIKPEDVIPGEQLESDRYLILVEEMRASVSDDQSQASSISGNQSTSSNGSMIREMPRKFVNSAIQQSHSLSAPPISSRGSNLRPGLKRKRTGFVPPRIVKAVCTEPPVNHHPKQVDVHSSSSNPSVDITNLYSSENTPSDDIKPSYSHSTLSPQLSILLSSLRQSKGFTNPNHRQFSSDDCRTTIQNDESSGSTDKSCQQYSGHNIDSNIGTIDQGCTTTSQLYGSTNFMKANDRQMRHSRDLSTSKGCTGTSQHESKWSKFGQNLLISDHKQAASDLTNVSQVFSREPKMVEVNEEVVSSNKKPVIARSGQKRSASQILALLGTKKNLDQTNAFKGSSISRLTSKEQLNSVNSSSQENCDDQHITYNDEPIQKMYNTNEGIETNQPFDKIDHSKKTMDEIDHSKEPTAKLDQSKEPTDKIDHSKEPTDKIDSSREPTDKIYHSNEPTDGIDHFKDCMSTGNKREEGWRDCARVPKEILKSQNLSPDMAISSYQNSLTMAGACVDMNSSDNNVSRRIPSESCIHQSEDELSDEEVQTNDICFEISFSPTSKASDIDTCSDITSVDKNDLTPKSFQLEETGCVNDQTSWTSDIDAALVIKCVNKKDATLECCQESQEIDMEVDKSGQGIDGQVSLYNIGSVDKCTDKPQSCDYTCDQLSKFISPYKRKNEGNTVHNPIHGSQNGDCIPFDSTHHRKNENQISCDSTNNTKNENRISQDSTHDNKIDRNFHDLPHDSHKGDVISCKEGTESPCCDTVCSSIVNNMCADSAESSNTNIADSDQKNQILVSDSLPVIETSNKGFNDHEKGTEQIDKPDTGNNDENLHLEANFSVNEKLGTEVVFGVDPTLTSGRLEELEFSPDLNFSQTSLYKIPVPESVGCLSIKNGKNPIRPNDGQGISAFSRRIETKSIKSSVAEKNFCFEKSQENVINSSQNSAPLMCSENGGQMDLPMLSHGGDYSLKGTDAMSPTIGIISQQSITPVNKSPCYRQSLCHSDKFTSQSQRDSDKFTSQSQHDSDKFTSQSQRDTDKFTSQIQRNSNKFTCDSDIKSLEIDLKTCDSDMTSCANNDSQGSFTKTSYPVDSPGDTCVSDINSFRSAQFCNNSTTISDADHRSSTCPQQNRFNPARTSNFPDVASCESQKQTSFACTYKLGDCPELSSHLQSSRCSSKTFSGWNTEIPPHLKCVSTADVFREQNNAVLVSDDFVAPGDKHCPLSSIHPGLPHPSALTGSRLLGHTAIRSASAKLELATPVRDTGNSKLDSYKVKGSVSGSAVTRTSRNLPVQTFSPTPFVQQQSLFESCSQQRKGTGTVVDLIFSQGNQRSPLSNYSELENSEDDCSFFVDANNGKPKFIVESTWNPRFSNQNCESPAQFVPEAESRSCSPLTAHEVPTEYSTAMTGNPVSTQFSEDLDIPTFSEFIKSQKFQKEKRNSPVELVTENTKAATTRHIKVNEKTKKKTPLKSKPFNDAYTHTSYSNYHFSPGRHYSKMKENIPDDFSSNSCSPQIKVKTYISNGSNSTIQSQMKNNVCGKKQSHKLSHENQNELFHSNAASLSANCKAVEVSKECVSENTDSYQDMFSDFFSEDQKFNFSQNSSCEEIPHGKRDEFANAIIPSSPKTAENLAHTKDSQQGQTLLLDNVFSTGKFSKWEKFVHSEDSDEDFDALSCSVKRSSSSVGESSCFVEDKAKSNPPFVNEEKGDNSSKINRETGNFLSGPKGVASRFQSEWSDSDDDLDCSLFHSPDRFLDAGKEKKLSEELCSVSNENSETATSNFHQLRKPVEVLNEKYCQSFGTISPEIERSNILLCNKQSDYLQKEKESASEMVFNDCKLRDGVSTLNNIIYHRERNEMPPSIKSCSASQDVSQNGQNCHPAMSDSQMAIPCDTDILSSGITDGRKQVPTRFQTPVVRASTTNILTGSQRNLCGGLQFPCQVEIQQNTTPTRQTIIPVSFPSLLAYKQVFTAALKEHLNILLFELSKGYHLALQAVDTTGYDEIYSNRNQVESNKKKSMIDGHSCNCGEPAKFVQVKKEGANKGRFFYACSKERSKQCKFFQWADQVIGKTGANSKSAQTVCRPKLSDAASITTLVRGQKIMFFCGCQFIRRVDAFKNFRKNVPAWVRNSYTEDDGKKKMYLKLSKKESSSLFNKDDLWIISKHLEFDPVHTFLARSTYFGPNSNSEVELEPLSGFSPSNWSHEACCHAILAGNAASELSYILTLEEHLKPAFVPILPQLLNRIYTEMQLKTSTNFRVPVQQSEVQPNIHLTSDFVNCLATEFTNKYNLNTDQRAALEKVAAMFYRDETDDDPFVLVHGVFGAGKSFLLSVIVMFLVKLFEENDIHTPGLPYPWRLLISSTTNVAVDRILKGLLELGFEEFVRVGSVKKIAKPVLPKSVHATGSASQELKDLQGMLRSGELTPAEK